jgi:hypothetical protein
MRPFALRLNQPKMRGEIGMASENMNMPEIAFLLSGALQCLKHGGDDKGLVRVEDTGRMDQKRTLTRAQDADRCTRAPRQPFLPAPCLT